MTNSEMSINRNSSKTPLDPIPPSSTDERNPEEIENRIATTTSSSFQELIDRFSSPKSTVDYLWQNAYLEVYLNN